MKKTVALIIVLAMLVSVCMTFTGCFKKKEKELTPKEKIMSLSDQLTDAYLNASPFALSREFIESLNNYNVNLNIEELSAEGESILPVEGGMTLNASGAFSKTGFTSALNLKFDSGEIGAELQSSDLKAFDIALPEVTESVIRYGFSDNGIGNIEQIIKEFVDSVVTDDRIAASKEDITSLGKEYKQADRYDITLTNEEIAALAEKIASSFNIPENDITEDIEAEEDNVNVTPVISVWFEKNNVIKAQLVADVKVAEPESAYKLTAVLEGTAENGNADITANILVEGTDIKVELPIIYKQTVKDGKIEGSITAEIKGEGEMLDMIELPVSKIGVSYEGTVSEKTSDINFKITAETPANITINIPFNVKTELTDSSIKANLSVDTTIIDYKAKLYLTVELSKGTEPAFKTYEDSKIIDLTNIDDADETTAMKLLGLLSEIGTYASENCPELTDIISALFFNPGGGDDTEITETVAYLNSPDGAASLELYNDGTVLYNTPLESKLDGMTLKAKHNGVDLTFAVVDDDTVSINGVEYDAMSYEWEEDNEKIYTVFPDDYTTYILTVSGVDYSLSVADTYSYVVEDGSKLTLNSIKDNGAAPIVFTYEFVSGEEMKVNGEDWFYSIYNEELQPLGEHPEITYDDEFTFEDVADETASDYDSLFEGAPSRM